MALNDESFYNLIGEEISREYLVDLMINYYRLKKQVGETKVTDFNEGSEIRNILEAIAVAVYALMEEENELTKIGFIDTADGDFLDLHGRNPFINLERDTGTEAQGSVTFSIAEALTSEMIIPSDTVVVASDSGLSFVTLNDGILSVGDTEVTIAVECETTGADGNVGTGEIDTIDYISVDLPGLTVTNEEPLVNGSDYEDDEDYRERLLAYTQKDDFGSLPYYNNLANEIDGVHDVYLVDDENEVYTKIVLVNGDTRPTPAEVLLEVLETYNDVNKHVVGHSFSVNTPTYYDLDLIINLSVSTEIDEAILNDVFSTWINGGNCDTIVLEFDGLFIGQSVDEFAVKDTCTFIDTIIDAEILDSEGNPFTELSVDDDECIKMGDIQFNQTVV